MIGFLADQLGYFVLVDQIDTYMTLITAGNLLNRTLGLLKKNCQSTLVVDSTIAAEEQDFKDTVEKLVRLF